MFGSHNLTMSQVSGVMEAHYEERTAPWGGETLLAQYKQCSAINDQALRQAKNIKDLVKINVATLDKKLYVSQRGKSISGSIKQETTYNLQYDPINFMQKVPLLGDREFLVNQSILHSSTTKNRVSEAVSRQKFMQQSRNSSAYMTGQPQPTRQGGLQGLLPELPLSGFQAGKRTRQSLVSHKSGRTASNQHQGRSNIAVTDDQLTKVTTVDVADEAYEMDSVQMTGRGSQIDPVRCLQQIFRQNNRKERRPGVNLIAEKYKNIAKSVQSRQGSRTVATANTFMQSFPDQPILSDVFSLDRNNLVSPQGEAQTHFFDKKDRSSFPATPVSVSKLTQQSGTKFAAPSTAPQSTARPGVAKKQMKNDVDADGKPFADISELKRNSLGLEAQKAAPTSLAQKMSAKRKTMPVSGSWTNPAEKSTQLNAVTPATPKATPSHVVNTQTMLQTSGVADLNLVSSDLTQAQIAIRDKLAKMGQIFDEEEREARKNGCGESGIMRPDSSEWDLHSHKIRYEEAMQKRQKHLELEEARKQSKGLHGETPRIHKDKKERDEDHNKNFEMQEDELREFLINRIADLQNNGQTEEKIDNGKFKFKASTISNLLPSGNIDEHSRLEANYKNRFRNKGEKLHKRMLNNQQRRHQERENATRKHVNETMQLHRKEMVSNRSKEAHSPSESALDSPAMRTQTLFISHERGGYYSKSGSVLMQQKHDAERQINTDLAGGEFNRSEGLSTEKASLHNSQMPRAPLTPPIRETDEDLAFRQKASEAPRLKLAVVTDEAEEMHMELESDQLPWPQPQNASQAHQKADSTPNTAVIFVLDSPKKGAAFQPKVNYFTQVLRQIETIDRGYAKDKKMRKKGLHPEDVELIKKAVQKQSPQSSVEESLTRNDLEESPEAQNQMLYSSVESANTSQDEQAELGMNQVDVRQSLEQAVMKRRQQHPTENPDDVVILQVTGAAVELEQNKARGVKKHGDMNFLSSVKPSHHLVHLNQSPSNRKRTRTMSPESQSRVNTAEQVLSIDGTDYKREIQEKRGSNVTTSVEPTTPIGMQSNLATLKHGQNKYSHPKIQTKQPLGDAQTIQQLAGVSSQHFAIKSLKVDCQGDQPQKVAAQTMNRSEVNKVERVKQEAKNTAVSVKLSELVSQDQEGLLSTARILSEHNHREHTPQLTSEPEEGDQRINRQQLKAIPNSNPSMASARSITMEHSVVTGSQLPFFCPKRYNRFPRFTIFFKKSDGCELLQENTMSLNADFLKFLADKRNSGSLERPVEINNSRQRIQIRGRPVEASWQMSSGDAEHSQGDNMRVPTEIEQWHNYLKQKKFDPFERVLLVKGIDNSILTSFRTLKGQNNTVSDTFKIVHRKFQPGQKNNSFVKNMVKSHVDKLPYQTMRNSNDVFMDEDLMGAFEVYEERLERGHSTVQQHFDVDPDVQREGYQSKLAHDITATLIEMEKGDGTPERQKSFQNRPQPPFRAQVNVGPKGGAARQNKSVKRPNQRSVPRAGRKQADQLNSQLGVQGVSPLTKMANKYLEESRQNQMAESSPNWHEPKSPVSFVQQKMLQMPGDQYSLPTSPMENGQSLQMPITATNSIYKVVDPVLEPITFFDEGPRKEVHQVSQKDGSSWLDGRLRQPELAPDCNQLSQGLQGSQKVYQLRVKTLALKTDHQQNNRFSSTAAVERRVEDTFLKNLSSKQQKSGYLGREHRAKSRNTDDVSSIDDVGALTNLSNVQTIGLKKLNSTTLAQKSSMQLDSLKTPASNVGLLAKENNLTETGGQNKTPPRIQESFKDQPSFSSKIRRASNGQDGSMTVKDLENESQCEFLAPEKNVLLSQFPQHHGLYQPTINVIKSNQQLVANTLGSVVALDSDATQKSRERGPSLDTNRIDATLDLMSGSPIVHQVFNGKKLRNQKKYGSLIHDSLQWSSTVQSPRNQKPQAGIVTDRSQRSKVPQPAPHTGVLKVPDSIKAQHFGSDVNIEEMAAKGQVKKGAVGSMIDKIYQKDRRMVNNMYKGIMLSTAVLTDMSRYHKLKSQTGVERKDFDEVWIQQRVEQEVANQGLALDCAPKNVKRGRSSDNETNEDALKPVSKQLNDAKQLAEAQKLSLAGDLGDLQRQVYRDSLEQNEKVDYADIINRSEQLRSESGTAFGNKPNYN